MRIFDASVRHVGAVWNGLRQIFWPRYENMPFEKIVFVAGINSTRGRVKKFEKFLRRRMPDKEIVIVQEYYIHNQEEKVEHMIEQATKVLDDDVKTLVIGHSFGGIVALAGIGRLADCSNVLLLATLASPHGIEEFGVLDAKQRHKVAESCDVPVLTFGGYADAVVPDEMSHCLGEVGHVSIPCTHIAFLKTTRTHKEVMAAIVQYFSVK